MVPEGLNFDDVLTRRSGLKLAGVSDSLRGLSFLCGSDSSRLRSRELPLTPNPSPKERGLLFFPLPDVGERAR